MLSLEKPIKTTDWVTLRARVVFVRIYTLQVEIQVGRQSGFESVTEPTHSGVFTLVNYDQGIGLKKKILTGLSLNEENQEELQSYFVARSRSSFLSKAEGKQSKL